MNGEEKALLQEAIDAASNNGFNSLQLKSMVLKMIADFFSKLKHKNTLCVPHHSMHELLAETERYLDGNIKGAMPNCKALACKYGYSEVSLKRHFKQQHGMNMSTYFMRKKMEYAQQLMQKDNITQEAAARMLGYKNIGHFVTIYQKHTNIVSANAMSA